MYPIFDLAGIQAPALGTMLGVGICVALLLIRIQSRRYEYSFYQLHLLTVIAFLGGSIGSRILHVAISGEAITIENLLTISNGTIYFGFLIGVCASIGLYAVLRSNDRDLWRELDILAPAWMSLQLFGRVGCFLAGCCYGTSTSLPWGVVYHKPLSDALTGVVLHPVQLYEAAIDLLLLGFALRRIPHERTSGLLFLRTVGLYSIARYFLEFLRGDARGTLLGALSTSQSIAVVVVPIAAIVFVFRSPTIRPIFRHSSAS